MLERIKNAAKTVSAVVSQKAGEWAKAIVASAVVVALPFVTDALTELSTSGDAIVRGVAGFLLVWVVPNLKPKVQA